ncbi:hypothetical protein D3C81_2212170 [compost metagenome]
MQQRRGRFAFDPGIAIRRASHHAFEQAQYAAHARDTVEGGNEVHFAGAGVGKTGVDTAVEQGLHQAFGAVD